jgi:enoyl-CoA hydratase/carnithine racemase
MTKLERAEEFADRLWSATPSAVQMIEADRRAVAKKVLEEAMRQADHINGLAGLPGHPFEAGVSRVWQRLASLANNPAELDRLLKE